MEHCLSLKYFMKYRPDLWNLLIQINSWKGYWELKLNWWLICYYSLTSKSNSANELKMVWKKCTIRRPGLWNLQNWLKAKKVFKSWNWSFNKWQYWMVSKINNAQACGHLQNMVDNLRTLLIQFTDQQKAAKKVANNWN